MTATNRLLTYLQQENIPYQCIEHRATDTLQQTALQCKLPSEQVARAVLLGDEHGSLLAVLPLNHVINFAKLFALAERRLEPIDRQLAQHIFSDCAIGSIPPVPVPYRIPALVDNALLEQDTIYLEPGSHTLLIKISGEDFRHLHRSSAQGYFSTPAQQLQLDGNSFVSHQESNRAQGIRQLRPVEELDQRLRQLNHLPSMHPIAQQLLKLQQDPDAGVDELRRIVETDPSISAQLMHHARSAYYGYPGEIENLHQAITLVLGFDTALNTALGLSALQAFELPKEGPLGGQSLLRHALHCAVLSKRLSERLPRHLDYQPGLVYLSGLLHNFGFFALGHLLKPEYFLLNRVVSANPDVPVTLIEKRTLGISHTQIGEKLMQAWNMPEVLRVTLREHHNETWQGQHFIYPNLVLLSNCLLKPFGIGDAADETPPASILNALGLSLQDAREVLEQHLEHARDIDEMLRGISSARAA